jgi:hypothetical protein
MTATHLFSQSEMQTNLRRVMQQRKCKRNSGGSRDSENAHESSAACRQLDGGNTSIFAKRKCKRISGGSRDSENAHESSAAKNSKFRNQQQFCPKSAKLRKKSQ